MARVDVAAVLVGAADAARDEANRLQSVEVAEEVAFS
jgi:hypothetical protein